MKKLGLILLLLSLASGTAYSQSIGAFVGYGQSAFGEDSFELGDETEQANYIPLGVQILFGTGGNFEIGGEINYAVVPFTFEMNVFDTHVADMEVEQLYFGALARFKIGTGSGIWPYIRGGAGIYTGSLNMNYTDEMKELYLLDTGMELEDESADFKSAFGFNAGVGAEINFSHNNGVFAEFVYHIVKREIDGEDAGGASSANNWALHVGFRFSLK